MHPNSHKLLPSRSSTRSVQTTAMLATYQNASVATRSFSHEEENYRERRVHVVSPSVVAWISRCGVCRSVGGAAHSKTISRVDLRMPCLRLYATRALVRRKNREREREREREIKRTEQRGVERKEKKRDFCFINRNLFIPLCSFPYLSTLRSGIFDLLVFLSIRRCRSWASSSFPTSNLELKIIGETSSPHRPE